MFTRIIDTINKAIYGHEPITGGQGKTARGHEVTYGENIPSNLQSLNERVSEASQHSTEVDVVAQAVKEREATRNRQREEEIELCFEGKSDEFVQWLLQEIKSDQNMFHMFNDLVKFESSFVGDAEHSARCKKQILEQYLASKK